MSDQVKPEEPKKNLGVWVPPADAAAGPFSSSHWTHTTFKEGNDDPNLPPPGVAYRRGPVYTDSQGRKFNTWMIPGRDPGVEQQIVDWASQPVN